MEKGKTSLLRRRSSKGRQGQGSPLPKCIPGLKAHWPPSSDWQIVRFLDSKYLELESSSRDFHVILMAATPTQIRLLTSQVGPIKRRSGPVPTHCFLYSSRLTIFRVTDYPYPEIRGISAGPLPNSAVNLGLAAAASGTLNRSQVSWTPSSLLIPTNWALDLCLQEESPSWISTQLTTNPFLWRWIHHRAFNMARSFSRPELHPCPRELHGTRCSAPATERTFR
jgi:hypothetical protein